MISQKEQDNNQEQLVIEQEPQTIEKAADNLNLEKLQNLSAELIEKITVSSEVAVTENTTLLNQVLENLKAEPVQFAEGRELIAPVNQEIGVLAVDNQNKIKQVIDKDKDENLFDRNQFISDVKVRLEKVRQAEDIFTMLKDVCLEQKSRPDLKLLFDNLKFGEDGQEQFIKVTEFFDNKIKNVDDILNDPEKMAELKKAPLDELTSELINNLDDFVPPVLENNPNSLEVISKVQNKVKVDDYFVSDLISFINGYNKSATGRENIFDKFIFKDFPKKKDNFLSIRHNVANLTESPEALEKIDLIISGNLNETLNLFDDSNSYERDYRSSEEASPTDNISASQAAKDEKGVNLFNTEYVQSERLSTLNQLSLESLKLAKDNKYFKIKAGDSYSSPAAINLITEDCLQKIHNFTGDISELAPAQIAVYLRKIENLSTELKEFLKKNYASEIAKGAFDSIGDYTLWDLIINEDNLFKIKKCQESGLITSLDNSYNLRKAVQFSASDLDLIIKIGADLDVNKDILSEINNLSESDLIKYQELKSQYNYLGSEQDILGYIKDLKKIPVADLDFFKRWEVVVNQSYSGQNNFCEALNRAVSDLDSLAKISEFYKNNPEADKIIFSMVAKSSYYLSDILNKLESFNENPKNYCLNNPKNTFANYDSLKEILDKRGETLSQVDLDDIFDSALYINPQIILDKNSFPITPEQAKIVEFCKNDSKASFVINYIVNNQGKANLAMNIKTFLENPKQQIMSNLRNVFVNYDELQGLLNKRGETLEPADLNLIFDYALKNNPQVFWGKNNFPFTAEQWNIAFDYIFENNPRVFIEDKKYNFTPQQWDLVFAYILKNYPGVFLRNKNFTFTAEQQKIIDIFTRINNSPSKEMKNMAAELSQQIALSGDLSAINERCDKIENIFIKNNIPFIGKQAKICEVLHPEIVTKDISSPELQSLHSNNAKRLLIFKDLLQSNFNSLNSNLEQYLLIFKNGQEVLDKYENGDELNNEEVEKLTYFFKKINALAENTRKNDNFKTFNSDNLNLEANLEALKNNFGVRANQTITEKFETTFLKRIGLNNISEAAEYFDNLRQTTNNRNEQLAESGQISLSENDLAKGVDLNFFDSNLDRGIYAPEFVGAESANAKMKSQSSDSTPWDTDLIKVGQRNVLTIAEESAAAGYGDVILIIKDRGQFNKTEKDQPILADQNKLELFKTGAIGADHYGIRTGFGSTEIGALLVKDAVLNDNKQLDSLKFSIAKKGFYIPICDKTGQVIFTANDFKEYRKIFTGVDKYHGDQLEISEKWQQSKFSEDIKEFSQTKENLDKISNIRNSIFSDIENDLKSLGVELHKGRYDDSVVGAKIIDTGSTGRGAALDSGYDFDFVIKIDDSDADKINQLAEILKKAYPYDQDYESAGMRTFRFKSFEKDGNTIDLDISFIKKSDSEELDANEAVAKKYDSIKESVGEDKLLDVLTNIRFAKKELKKAGCYKKGLTGNGEQQGGLGGIGVENWILKNGGDAVAAFQEFNSNAFENGKLVSFDDFKQKYKLFSAGENIRGGVRAENFVYNMDPSGYEKMAELSRKFV